MSPAKTTYKLIPRADVKSWDPVMGYRRLGTKDYVEVPRLSTYGTFSIVEMLEFDILAKLAALRTELFSLRK